MMSLSRDNLNACIETTKPLYNLLILPFKRENNTIDNVERAISLYPAHEVYLDPYAVQTGNSCWSVMSLPGVIEKAEGMRNVLHLKNTFVLLHSRRQLL